jgi:phage terminase small subunit
MEEDEEIEKIQHKELSDQHRAFCKNILKGMNGSSAYRAVYACDSTNAVVAAGASRILAMPHVKAYLEKMRKARDERLVLSIQEKREYLAKVVRTAIKDVKPDSELIQEITINKHQDKKGEVTTKTTFKLPSKLDAIKIDNAMMGHNARTEIDVNLSVHDIYNKILESEDTLPIVKNVTPPKEETKQLPNPLEGMQ